jgi:UDP-N-acetylglucosamine 2-epimerase (non-hydrolysing)
LITKEYFVVSAHREENVSNPDELKKLLDSLNQLAKHYNNTIIVSTHPRFKKELDKSGEVMNPIIQFIKPLKYSDYVHLQMNAFCTLSDSGTISEESAILGFPAVNIRYSQERPEAFEMGVLPLVGLEFHSIVIGIKFALGRKFATRVPSDYLENQFSYRVINILLN